MKFLEKSFAHPAMNLACDEALLEAVEADGESAECLRIWEATSYFVVLGHSNRIAAHANMDACRAEKIPILRRMSGGGTVVQGPGCLNYALLMKDRERRSIREIFQYVLERHCGCFAAACSKAPRFRGTSDLTIGDLKFSGNAQYRKASAVLVHGTFLLDFDIAVIERLLPVPVDQPEYRGNRTHHHRFLTNLNVSKEKVVHELQRAWNAEDAFAPLPIARIKQLTDERYDRMEWTEKF
jgi:lipoate-protein ligase A